MRVKTCTTCREPWPLECFTRDPSSPDGHERRCKACRYERRDALARGAVRVRPWGTRLAFVGTDATRARDRARKMARHVQR